MNLKKMMMIIHTKNLLDCYKNPFDKIIMIMYLGERVCK